MLFEAAALEKVKLPTHEELRPSLPSQNSRTHHTMFRFSLASTSRTPLCRHIKSLSPSSSTQSPCFVNNNHHQTPQILDTRNHSSINCLGSADGLGSSARRCYSIKIQRQQRHPAGAHGNIRPGLHFNSSSDCHMHSHNHHFYRHNRRFFSFRNFLPFLSPGARNFQNNASQNENNHDNSSQGSSQKDFTLPAPEATSSFSSKFFTGISFALLAYVMYNLYNSQKGMSSLFESEIDPVKPGDEDVRLSDVKGIDDCKEEIHEVIEFLKNREKYKSVGAKMPKGVLLVGPPGTGKTLLAKAVANESGVNFLYASGSQFDEVLVGIGAGRVRGLFSSARKHAPCVVFIDELETVGMKRGHLQSNRQTLNQLLAELDGVNAGKDILFIGATNLVDMVDPALLRPGRFDRIINVPPPDLKGRKELFEHYLNRKRNISPDVSIPKLAKVTVGMTGADIESIVNEAAIYAAKHAATAIDMHALEYALDRGTMGVELKERRVTDRDLSQTAVHEIGHALIPILNGSKMDIRKVTVIPRGGSVGHTSFLPLTESQFHHSKKNTLLQRIDGALAGIIAEEVIFGKDTVSVGASSDMHTATNIAREMVSQFGMSENVGPAVFVETQDVPVSNKIKSAIDAEVERIVKDRYERTRNLLTKHKTDLQRIADELKRRETMTGNDIRELLGMEKVHEETL